jgi:hypothetical protein
MDDGTSLALPKQVNEILDMLLHLCDYQGKKQSQVAPQHSAIGVENEISQGWL